MHSAVGIPVEMGDHSTSKHLKGKKTEWADENRKYLIIDEVSMLDCKVITQLHEKLCAAKSSNSSVLFGGVNIMFFGDFLQLPSISPFKLYKRTARWQLGYDLWHSLNVVVLLKDQVRQAEDPRFAELLHNLRLRRPTTEDLALLRSRIGAPIPGASDAPIVVRRHQIRHALNLEKLHAAASLTNTLITYCMARIIKKRGMSTELVYKLRMGNKNVQGDAVLALIPGAPLQLTKNISVPLGNSRRLSRLIISRSRKRRHRQILRLFGRRIDYIILR